MCGAFAHGLLHNMTQAQWRIKVSASYLQLFHHKPKYTFAQVMCCPSPINAVLMNKVKQTPTVHSSRAIAAGILEQWRI